MASPAARVAVGVEDAEQLRIRRGLFLALALLHVAGILWLDRAMRLRPRVPAAPVVVEDTGVVIRFLPDAAVPAPAPEPAESAPAAAPALADPPRAAPINTPPAAVLSANPFVTAPPGIPATPAPAADAGPIRAPGTTIDTSRLFEPDGSPRLSEEVVEAAAAKPVPEYIARTAPGLAPIRSPIPYKPTRFDEVWVPDGESLGQELVRKATPEKEFKTPWGTRWRCKWVLVIAVCGDVPPPAAKNAPKAPWETYEPEPEDPEREIEF